MNSNLNQLWPALPYEEFKQSQHLLHMFSQAMGKLKLNTPFEPHWANVALWLTSRGLTTGIIPYGMEYFSVDMDLINHQIICTTSRGDQNHFALSTNSVAELTKQLFATLRDMGINIAINPLPQEIPNPIPFDQDTIVRTYNPQLAQAWWRILISTHQVMQRYHARFKGSTPPIGLMWGTFDLRDARYTGKSVATKDESYIRRNAMDVVQVETGWWSGNPNYPRAAYFSFTYPQPKSIEQAKIKPESAHWDSTLKEFILDYDDLRAAKNPEEDLLLFFETAYQAGAEKAGWNPNLIGTGEPV